MYVIGIVGWKNSGKTTLVEKLIPILRAQGATVSTIKHTHHAVDLDRPGKDSFRHREAGAQEVAIVSSARWILLHENQQDEKVQFQQMLERMTPVDIVLVEGFKSLSHDKIELRRGKADGDLFAESDPAIRAVASDSELAIKSIPRFDIDDPDAIAAFILTRAGLGPR